MPYDGTWIINLFPCNERQQAKAQILQIFDTRTYICCLGPERSGKRTLLAAVRRELAAQNHPIFPV